MAMAGIYRRVLPSPPAIDFASTSGKELFLEAVQNGTMEGFYKLISHFQTQSEPAYCGLASLSMVLNALAIDPGRTWKGPWRWFDESMLDCCEPLEKVKSKGISFRKLECLAHCAGANVRAIHTDESSLDEFRSYVEGCSKSDECHVISSYHRGIFKQTGSGHFSPIGGYHARKDMALILDVARFKYPPHWVPLPLLWDAMSTVDKASGQHRGYMLVSRQQLEPSVLYTLSCKHESWENIATYLTEDVPLLLKSQLINTIEGIISCVCMSMPTNFRDFIKWVAEVRRHEDAGQNLSEDEIQRLELKEELLKQVKGTGLYQYVTRFLSSAYQCSTKAAKLGCEYTLSDIAGAVCCEGAELLIGHPSYSRRFRCPKTSVGSLKGDGNRSVTVVTGTVMDGLNKQGLQLLVPGTQIKSVCCFDPGDCEGSHPTGKDVLTVLLLALPMQTWTGIRDTKLLMELSSLVSAENLPSLLKKEVLHLRRQLALLKRCQNNNNVDGNIH